MDRYTELKERLSEIDSELKCIVTSTLPGIDARIQALTVELRSVQDELWELMDSREEPEGKSHWQTGDHRGVGRRADGFEVRQPAVDFRPKMVSDGDRSVRRRDVEFQFGKTIMSVIASFLILWSIVLFGGKIYPYLDDGMKSLAMYTASLLFVGAGMLGRKTTLKTFFTAVAACGVGAVYLSGVISYFMFGVFGVGVLFFLTLCWVVYVAWLSSEKIPVFAYICYLGIIISTVLCLFEFRNSPVSLICYLVGITVLYMFNKTSSHRKDMFYWIQFPIVMLVMLFGFDRFTFMQLWLMTVAVTAFIIQHYLYREKDKLYGIVMFLTEAVLVVGYEVCSYEIGSAGFWNITFVLLTGLVSIWSYFNFEDKFCKLAPLVIMSLLVPLCNWGSFYHDYISYLPFCVVILFVGYLMNISVMKGIACGYLVVYTLNPPVLLDIRVFYLLLVVYGVLNGMMFFSRGKLAHVCGLSFLVSTGAILTCICNSESNILLVMSYLIAVLLSWLFNSPHFVCSDFTQRMGWTWNGYWLIYGLGSILYEVEDTTTVIFLFLALLGASLITVRWQLQCKHWFASFEFCIKYSVILWAILHRLSVTGVAVSIAFLLMAIGAIILGAFVKLKPIRLYGLVLSIVSVIKCLIFDSSGIFRPLGLLIAGLLCFGISYVYSVLERKLGDEP